MRINCPFCGLRDAQEFTYLGAADLKRPDGLEASAAAMHDYVYLRDNPAGPHRELWYHSAGLPFMADRDTRYPHTRDSGRRGHKPGKTGRRGMTQPFRATQGGLIARNRPLGFRFDGKSYSGYEGDTLASALLANGVRLVGRSFKYHRPRGILTAGSEEPNALVELRSGARREPNTRATTAELFDGLEATSQNRWPSLDFDLLSVNQFFGPAFTAGFYYKTFMWPASFWEKLYEPLIRRAAGLGRAAEGEDPDHYEKAFAFCDLLVIGGGPAGLSAALTAGRAGARVILCDEDFLLGGRLLSERYEINGQPASMWLEATIGELASLPNVIVMPRTTVFGTYDHGILWGSRACLGPSACAAALPAPAAWLEDHGETVAARLRCA